MQPNDTDLVALGFQTLATLALATVHLGLWRQRRQAFHLTWTLAWLLYAIRLGCISMYLVERQDVWLFGHQIASGLSALLLLLAARQFSSGARWRWVYAWAVPATIAWAWFAVFRIHSMAVAGTSSVLLLSAVTLWTAGVFWRQLRREPSTGARVLAWAYTLWGLHHLDYPILRAQGAGVLYGVFADVTCIVAVAVGVLTLVLGQERAALERRSLELEQLTQLLLRAQEEERRRIARELHDEAGQALTALKIELDLEGRKDMSAMVARVLDQVRNVSNLLRPQALDDLGLGPALGALIDDFSRRTRIEVRLVAGEREHWPPQTAMVLYRVAQESLTNVARHSGAARAWVTLDASSERAQLVIEDDGHGIRAESHPHLGILGMQERVQSAGGRLALERSVHGGLRVVAFVPLEGVS